MKLAGGCSTDILAHPADAVPVQLLLVLIGHLQRQAAPWGARAKAHA